MISDLQFITVSIAFSDIGSALIKSHGGIISFIEEIFKSYDYVLTPTSPSVAFNIGDKNTDPTQMYLEDIFTVLANLSGNPAISMPINNHSLKLPYGFQIMGRNFDEEGILSFSKNYF